MKPRRGTAWPVVLAAGLAMCAAGVAMAGPQVAITIVGQMNLAFGDVLPGINEEVFVTDAAAGKWSIDGDPSTSVTLTFVALPSTFTSGANSVTVIYGATQAAYNTVDDPATATVFDPAAGATATTGGDGKLYVWLGGTIVPSPVQAAGSYTATITLDAAY